MRIDQFAQMRELVYAPITHPFDAITGFWIAYTSTTKFHDQNCERWDWLSFKMATNTEKSTAAKSKKVEGKTESETDDSEHQVAQIKESKFHKIWQLPLFSKLFQNACFQRPRSLVERPLL